MKDTGQSHDPDPSTSVHMPLFLHMMLMQATGATIHIHVSNRLDIACSYEQKVLLRKVLSDVLIIIVTILMIKFITKSNKVSRILHLVIEADCRQKY